MSSDANTQNLTDGFHLVLEALQLNGLDTIYGVPGIPVTDLGPMAQAKRMSLRPALNNRCGQSALPPARNAMIKKIARHLITKFIGKK